MGHGLSDDDDEITGINVTPLVDIMLVLLIIFMVTTTVIVNKSISVELPKAATAEDKNTSKNLAFVLDKDSKLYLDGQPVSYMEVPQKISEMKQVLESQGISLQALITADKVTPHGEVVKLIDTIRKNGITEFAFNVEAETAEVK